MCGWGKRSAGDGERGDTGSRSIQPVTICWQHDSGGSAANQQQWRSKSVCRWLGFGEDEQEQREVAGGGGAGGVQGFPEQQRQQQRVEVGVIKEFQLH